eukprot:1157485-Pelagomonas_calceolata.AAC.1
MGSICSWQLSLMWDKGGGSGKRKSSKSDWQFLIQEYVVDFCSKFGWQVTLLVDAAGLVVSNMQAGAVVAGLGSAFQDWLARLPRISNLQNDPRYIQSSIDGKVLKPWPNKRTGAQRKQ